MGWLGRAHLLLEEEEVLSLVQKSFLSVFDLSLMVPRFPLRQISLHLSLPRFVLKISFEHLHSYGRRRRRTADVKSPRHLLIHCGLIFFREEEGEGGRA